MAVIRSSASVATYQHSPPIYSDRCALHERFADGSVQTARLSEGNATNGGTRFVKPSAVTRAKGETPVSYPRVNPVSNMYQGPAA